MDKTLSERMQAEVYALSRTAEKLLEMGQRDGYLHPATLDELTHGYVRVIRSADRVWMDREKERSRYE